MIPFHLPITICPQPNKQFSPNSFFSPHMTIAPPVSEKPLVCDFQLSPPRPHPISHHSFPGVLLCFSLETCVRFISVWSSSLQARCPQQLPDWFPGFTTSLHWNLGVYMHFINTSQQLMNSPLIDEKLNKRTQVQTGFVWLQGLFHFPKDC